jgi:hypothetical protein
MDPSPNDAAAVGVTAKQQTAVPVEEPKNMEEMRSNQQIRETWEAMDMTTEEPFKAAPKPPAVNEAGLPHDLDKLGLMDSTPHSPPPRPASNGSPHLAAFDPPTPLVDVPVPMPAAPAGGDPIPQGGVASVSAAQESDVASSPVEKAADPQPTVEHVEAPVAVVADAAPVAEVAPVVEAEMEPRAAPEPQPALVVEIPKLSTPTDAVAPPAVSASAMEAAPVVHHAAKDVQAAIKPTVGKAAVERFGEEVPTPAGSVPMEETLEDKPAPAPAAAVVAVAEPPQQSLDSVEDPNAMPLGADFEFFPEPRKHLKPHHHVMNAHHQEWHLSDLMWDLNDMSAPPQASGEPSEREMMEAGGGALLQEKAESKGPGLLTRIMSTFAVPHEPTALISAFTGSTNMLELASVAIPAISGSRSGAYHTPSSFVWGGSNQAQSFALDVPDEFDRLTISGAFHAKPVADHPVTEPITLDWSLFLKDDDEIKQLSSGSFDVEKDSVSLSRQGDYYRRVEDNRALIAVGKGKIDISNCRGKQVMLWMKPSANVHLEIADDLVYLFH